MEVSNVEHSKNIFTRLKNYLSPHKQVEYQKPLSALEIQQKEAGAYLKDIGVDIDIMKASFQKDGMTGIDYGYSRPVRTEQDSCSSVRVILPTERGRYGSTLKGDEIVRFSYNRNISMTDGPGSKGLGLIVSIYHQEPGDNARKYSLSAGRRVGANIEDGRIDLSSVREFPPIVLAGWLGGANGRENEAPIVDPAAELQKNFREVGLLGAEQNLDNLTSTDVDKFISTKVNDALQDGTSNPYFG